MKPITKFSIEMEVNKWISECMRDQLITDENHAEWSYWLFDDSWYVHTDKSAMVWLEKHGLDVFEAISYVIAHYADRHFDIELLSDPKKLVSTVVSIYGGNLIETYNAQNIIELAESYT